MNRVNEYIRHLIESATLQNRTHYRKWCAIVLIKHFNIQFSYVLLTRHVLYVDAVVWLCSVVNNCLYLKLLMRKKSHVVNKHKWNLDDWTQKYDWQKRIRFPPFKSNFFRKLALFRLAICFIFGYIKILLQLSVYDDDNLVMMMMWKLKTTHAT